MTLFLFLRLVGDLSLFYAVANAFLCMTSCDVTFVPLIVLSLCGALSYFLVQKKEVLRFLPILLMPLALIFPYLFSAFGLSPLLGLYVAEPVSDLVSASTCTIIFFAVEWKKLRPAAA